jgi:2-methylcitrate dehydratase PrpD
MIHDIADYLRSDAGGTEQARENALRGLTNSLADGFSALHEPDIADLLGPRVPGATLAHGARVPGTSLELDPPMAAFNIGAMVCCVDLAAILAVADYLARRAHNDGRAPLRVGNVLTALIKARALRGLLAAGPKPSSATLCATTAVLAQVLGGHARQIAAAVAAACHHDAPRGRVIGVAASRRAAAAAGSVVRWAWAAVYRDEPPSSLTPVSRQYDDGPEPESDACHFAAEVLRGGAGRVGDLGRGVGGDAGGHSDDDGRGDEDLQRKFAASVAAHFAPVQAGLIIGRFAARATLEVTPVNEFMAGLVKNG